MEKTGYIEILIKKITYICREKNISPHMLGKESGVGKDFLANINKGSLPSCDKLAKVADYCDVSVDYLLGRTDEPNISSGHSIRTGSIGSKSSHCDTSVKIPDATRHGQLDETTQQLVQVFQSLDFIEKSKVMGLIAELISK